MRSGNKYNLHFGINSFWKFTYNFKTIKLSSIFKLRLFFLSKVCLLLYRLKPFSIKFYEYNSFFIFSIWIFFFLKKKIKKIRKKNNSIYVDPLQNLVFTLAKQGEKRKFKEETSIVQIIVDNYTHLSVCPTSYWP